MEYSHKYRFKNISQFCRLCSENLAVGSYVMFLNFVPNISFYILIQYKIVISKNKQRKNKNKKTLQSAIAFISESYSFALYFIIYPVHIIFPTSVDFFIFLLSYDALFPIIQTTTTQIIFPIWSLFM